MFFCGIFCIVFSSFFGFLKKQRLYTLLCAFIRFYMAVKYFLPLKKPTELTVGFPKIKYKEVKNEL